MENRVLSVLESLRVQRSHILFILSNAQSAFERDFLSWYSGKYRESVLKIPYVLNLNHFEQDPIDITMGQNPRIPFRYLGICEISVDGAEAASDLIEQVTRLHASERSAREPATWLYYPVSEKVGRGARQIPCMLTVAFANGFLGREAEFREWYATRHIRHAMKVPALVSGQCFQRTLFQSPGAMEPTFAIIAVYEQEGSPESIIESFQRLPAEALHFPAMDESRFAEAVYQPLT